MIRFLPYAGWPLAALVFWLWLGARDDLAAEVERCNADKLESIANAEAITRSALENAHSEQLAELARQVAAAERARAIADRARVEAEERPIETRTIIREVASADPESCLNQPVPDSVIDSLR